MISATPFAADKIKYFLEKRGKGLGIKVGVKTTGCSGLAYTLEFIDQPDETYAVYESYGVMIWLSPKDAVYLKGLTVDYAKQGLNEGFEFINPQEKDRCGCGESFRI
jgi:iron-sulfur cluster assembly protein